MPRHVLALAWLLLACAPERPPADPLPEGIYLTGDASALRALVDSLARLQGTPLARDARSLGAAAADCDEFVAHAPSGRVEELTAQLRCSEPGSQPAGMVAVRGDADLAFSLPVAGDGHVTGALSLDESGSVHARASIDPLPSGRLASFLVPASEPPAPSLLSRRDALLHARLRPASGLDLSGWVSPESQADLLFKLKSDLFLGTVLEGSVELVGYVPRPGRAMPGLALAVDTAVHGAAVAGMQRFIADLEEAWPIRHQSVELAGHPGACFFDLRILPEFAPCYVAPPGALVVGWNPESLELALAGPPPAAEHRADGALPTGRFELRLGRLAEADALLQAAVAPDAASTPLDYTWERLVVTGRREDGPVTVDIALLGAGRP